jgi:hypothetical protein
VLNLVKLYKKEHAPKTPMSNIMARCLFDEKNILSLLFSALFLAFVTEWLQN